MGCHLETISGLLPVVELDYVSKATKVESNSYEIKQNKNKTAKYLGIAIPAYFRILHNDPNLRW